MYSETASSDFCEWENFLENKGTENLGNMVFYFGILCDFAKKSGSFLRPSHAQPKASFKPGEFISTDQMGP